MQIWEERKLIICFIGLVWLWLLYISLNKFDHESPKRGRTYQPEDAPSLIQLLLTQLRLKIVSACFASEQPYLAQALLLQLQVFLLKRLGVGIHVHQHLWRCCPPNLLLYLGRQQARRILLVPPLLVFLRIADMRKKRKKSRSKRKKIRRKKRRSWRKR